MNNISSALVKERKNERNKQTKKQRNKERNKEDTFKEFALINLFEFNSIFYACTCTCIYWIESFHFLKELMVFLSCIIFYLVNIHCITKNLLKIKWFTCWAPTPLKNCSFSKLSDLIAANIHVIINTEIWAQQML